jgi:hypothetical protein
MAKKNRTGIPRAAISVEEAAEALGIGLHRAPISWTTRRG